MKAMTTPSKNLREGLIEKLAAIEHERWSDWQKYMHSKCTPSADEGVWLIGKEFIDRWERQIATPFEKLTEKEKESDREQVYRYLPLLSSEIEKAKEERDSEWVKMCEEMKMLEIPNYPNLYNSALNDIINKLKNK